jgi:AAHS family 4-hydroxybenzoate transporter-like MFS transporter
MMWAGMPLGSVIASFVAAWLLPHHGWQSLFWVGGIPPILVGVMVAMFLPESLAFLVRQGKDKLAIRNIISKISPAMAADRETEFYGNEKKLAGVPVKHLFTEGRAFTTIAIWLLFFLSFYLLWVMLSWTPTLLRHAGASIQQYSVAYAFLNLGSLVAALVIGRLMDKFDVYHVLEIWFVLAFITVSIFGLGANHSFMVVAILAGITGLFVNGGNSGLMALGTISYPTSIRGSGIGWAYGVGKVGSMLGPVVGGVLLARSWSVVNGLSGLLIAVIIVVLGRHAFAARRKAVPEMASAASAH